jgi:hypothetical protein
MIEFAVAEITGHEKTGFGMHGIYPCVIYDLVLSIQQEIKKLAGIKIAVDPRIRGTRPMPTFWHWRALPDRNTLNEVKTLLKRKRAIGEDVDQSVDYHINALRTARDLPLLVEYASGPDNFPLIRRVSAEIFFDHIASKHGTRSDVLWRQAYPYGVAAK